jgi:diacylglycerol kinase (ATP)
MLMTPAKQVIARATFRALFKVEREAAHMDQRRSDAGARAEPHGESPFKGKTGLRRLMNATRYSLHGFASAYRHEDAFRQEVLLAAVMIPLALVLDAAAIGKALMIASVLLVLIVELLNSAIEAAVDRISLDRHRLSKRAKDIGSAAVFLSLVNVACVWGLVLFG